MNLKKYLPVPVLTGIIIILQLAFSLTGTVYYLTQITMSIYYSIVVIGLCLLMGYAGQLSLGHAAFFAAGGYTQAVLTTINLVPYSNLGIIRFLLNIKMLTKRADLYGNEIISFVPWIAVIASVLITVLIAFLIGIPVLRLKGHYLAMATLGFGVIIHTVIIGTGFLGEADGISGVPDFELLPGLFVSDKMSIRIPNYYIACFLLVSGAVISINLINSRVGRALRSIHGNEEASNAIGVNTSKYKLYTFVMSAVFASVAGIFLTHYNGGIGPSEADIMKSVRYVAIVAVGGMSNLWGVISIGILLNFLSLRGYFGSYDDAVFGIILIAIMLFAPNGLLRLDKISAVLSKFRKKKA